MSSALFRAFCFLILDILVKRLFLLVLISFIYFCLSDPVNGEFEYGLVTLAVLLETHFHSNCE